MPDPIKQMLSSLLLFGILLAVIFVGFGASLYLLREGALPVSFSASASPLVYKTYLPILKDAFHLNPLAFILIGFLILVFSQVLRVLILGFYFLRNREYWLAASSFFIFIVLLSSILWQR